MNRFRSKKKEREDGAGPRPSMDSLPSSGPFRMFGKGKKSQDDDKNKELDFSTALPPSDDFRTSLLMTGLSARFSMLREQDDPSSKLGKASDDSVLFPKRQSRLMDFGLAHNLQDIVEVESIKNSYMGRLDSANDSDDGFNGNMSIMDRSRPNEGNNLFGGRQKIYKLGAGAKGGATGGRAVYDDDVAQSSFQKWRQAERERFASSLDHDELEEPQPDYSRRRETSSTASSALSAGRNSTAATSVNSQFGSSMKDSHSPLPTSSSAFGNLERSVTRTRRLYEQGLTQELHDQQSSTLSRMDNLSRARSRPPARTPELTPPVPSPTASGFGDRFTDRRPMMSKSSAPNLRSFSPQNGASSRTNSIEASKRNTSQEKQPAFGGNPPLSPPISEAEDHPALPIQPNDRGKATAMGLFTRPTHQYDDSKFAQRQVQMQKGRETPTGRSQTSAGSLRSRSSSSTQRTSSDKYEAAPTLKPIEAVQSRAGGSFFDDDDEDLSSSTNNIASSLGAHLSFTRPDDQDHPAFRKSALPTPLSLSSRDSDTSSISDKPQTSAQQLKDETAEDSPTLGPPSGLSGMVRQHLRSTSVASSVYDTNTDEQENLQPYVDSPPTKNGAAFNNWQLNDDELQTYSGAGTPNAVASPEKPPQFRSRRQAPEPSYEKEEEKEDFARHLADGARRVREKLTSYADTDAEQPSSIPPPIPEEPAKEQSSTKSNALGILRSKSSRGSLFDRNRDKDSFDGKSAKVPKLPVSSTSPSLQKPAEAPAPSAPAAENKESVHAGLKAFRQARRELQKMKELEVQQRNATGQKPDVTPERPEGHRTISHDHATSPPVYNPRHRDHSANGQRSRATSQAPSERDRSGSETSNNGYGQAYGARRGVSQTRAEDPFDQQYGRARSASQLAAASSTPNLNGSNSAPPLPPINPRRKNVFGGLSRRSEDAASLPSPRLTVNGGSDTGSDVENPRQNLRRITSDQGDQRHMHVPPPPSRRPPLPHANLSSNSMPGGMF